MRKADGRGAADRGAAASSPGGEHAWAEWFDSLHSATGKDRSRRWIIRAKHLADARFDRAVPLEAMASEAKLPKYHFIRSFRRIFRETPGRYRRRFAKGTPIDARAIPACLYRALTRGPAAPARTAISEKRDGPGDAVLS